MKPLPVVLVVTVERFRELLHGTGRVCLACGVATRDRRRRCTSCGAMEVYRVEEALIVDRLLVRDGQGEEVVL